MKKKVNRHFHLLCYPLCLSLFRSLCLPLFLFFPTWALGAKSLPAGSSSVGSSVGSSVSSSVSSLESSLGDLTIVAVGQAELENQVIAFEDMEAPQFFTSRQRKALDELGELFRRDFSFYKKWFKVKEASSENDGHAGRVKNPLSASYENWKSKGIDYYVRMSFSVTIPVSSILGPAPLGPAPRQSSAQRTDDLRYFYLVFDVRQKEILWQREGAIPLSELRTHGHWLTGETYRGITGRPSIFRSKIAFVSDMTSKRGKIDKELYIIDFDGKNFRRLTFHGGTVISPAFSHDGKKILYSLIRDGPGRKNIDLYLYNLEKKTSQKISSRRGMNSGAVFASDGKHIFLTLGHRGNAEIYEMNLASKKLRRITRHFAIDVDPSLSADGRKMAFLSGRSGKAMIYTADPSGTERAVKRISFVGKFNATPRFSPHGQEIAFSSWPENNFDIYRIGVDGRNLVRLTKNFGSNEDPSYSGDGQFIVFSSQKIISRSKAKQDLYIMDRDGDILGSVTRKMGHCITPRWSLQ